MGRFVVDHSTLLYSAVGIYTCNLSAGADTKSLEFYVVLLRNEEVIHSPILCLRRPYRSQVGYKFQGRELCICESVITYTPLSSFSLWFYFSRFLIPMALTSRI